MRPLPMSFVGSIAAQGARVLALAHSGGWLAGFRRVGRQAHHLSEAAMVIALMTLFACMPVDCASALGGYIARTIGPRLGVSRRALRNLRRALPENNESENRRVILGMWDNLGRAMAEYPHLAWICATTSGRVEIVNEEAIVHLLTDDKPAIVFGGHFGNWQVGPTTIHRLMGTSLLSVYRRANNPWVDRLQRRRLPSRLAVAKRAEGGRDLVRHLRRGGHIAMLVDQKQNDGVAVPFFGRDAMTAPAIARLGLHFDCPTVPIRIERLVGARFRFTVMPALEMTTTGDTAGDVLARMAQVNAVIEGWVRARPEQWLWLHRRWPD
jgi:KDO2-lipid IV(A) lauroyltransferase